MTLPSEGRVGMVSWTNPQTHVPWSVILADDFGQTMRALESWDRYKEQLGEIVEIWVSLSGLPTLPMAEGLLASFLAVGTTGAGLALSGVNCGYGGEGPHGTAKIFKDLGLNKPLVDLVFDHKHLHLVKLTDGRWMMQLDELPFGFTVERIDGE